MITQQHTTNHHHHISTQLKYDEKRVSERLEKIMIIIVAETLAPIYLNYGDGVLIK
jgi:hypothetical protein